MPISKHLRYEILRRDNYTCRYCGASAPWAVLVIDHLHPRKYGGSDAASNLVTACEDCNSGKLASVPEAWLAEEVDRVAQEWARYPHHEMDDEDELSEMYAYQEAVGFLEELPSSEVIHWIARMFVAAAPYKPTLAELMIAAAFNARRAVRDAAGDV